MLKPPAPTSGSRPELVVLPGLPALVAEIASRIRDAARAAVATRGRFRIALAGGSTPRALYPALATEIDWSRAEVFFGDERAVPPDDARSNYRMARETLLDPARVPPANVHRWRTEDADLDAAARDYEQIFTASAARPWLDLALLGLGPDGHTASLFPGTPALQERSRLAVAVDVPSQPERRLTLTYPALLDASRIFFLVAGDDKATALGTVLDPASTLPATPLVHRPGGVTIFCDGEAARGLPAAQ